MFGSLRVRRALDATADQHGRRLPVCRRCLEITRRCCCDDTDQWEEDHEL